LPGAGGGDVLNRSARWSMVMERLCLEAKRK